MKNRSILFLSLLIIFSCKKEKKADPNPEPEPVKTGTVSINVVSYDSLGNIETDFSGVQVSLYQTGFSATTSANGNVTFNNVPYGSILPVLVKYGYDGPPTSLQLNSESINLTLPCAKYSAYKINNLTGQSVNKDSITLSFSLSKAIPAGKVCKIAVLYSDNVLNASNFQKADSIQVTSQDVLKLNVAKLPNLKAALALLPFENFFSINIVPVSYGIFQSNLYGKQVLIGDNIYLPANLNFKKTWQ